MKRTYLKPLVLGALIIVSLADAHGIARLPDEKSDKSTVVSFNDVSSGDKLYIKDTDDRTLYSERIKKDGSYNKMFDLSNLPENQYYFEVDRTDEITLLPFDVERDNIILKKDLKTDIAKPQLVTQWDQVLLSRNVDGDQSLKIDIYYRGRDLVYSEELDKVGDLKRRYDFSSSMKGEYLFHIKYDDRIFTEYVNVR